MHLHLCFKAHLLFWNPCDENKRSFFPRGDIERSTVQTTVPRMECLFGHLKSGLDYKGDIMELHCEPS